MTSVALLAGLLFFAFAAQAQPLPVSDSLVRHYLSRAMTLQGFGALPNRERVALATWAGTSGLRFAGRVGGFWQSPGTDAEANTYFDSTRTLVAELHRVQPGVVVQGSIFEIVFQEANNLTVPNAVRAEFGEDTVAVSTRTFRLVDMMYPEYFGGPDSARYRWDNRPPGQAPGTPDMSRPETQRWFYTWARRQLDVGCEALHFGQVMAMDDHDPGHRGWWALLQRVRAYARTRNRGFVLCDAHTHGEYYDPDPAHPLPVAQRQLLFDFHSFPIRATETDTLMPGLHGTRLAATASHDPSGPIFTYSAGGRNPAGQYCPRQAALVELDNGGTAIIGKPNQFGYLWGLDEISWFAAQPSVYRDQWLVYATAWLQRYDPSTYFEVPGLRGILYPPGQADYRADRDGQREVITALWAGQMAARAQRLLLIGPPSPY